MQASARAATAEAAHPSIRAKGRHTIPQPGRRAATGAEGKHMSDSNKHPASEPTKVSSAHDELVANAHKALDLKRKAGPQTSTPSHRTSRGSKIVGPQLGMTDRDAGSQGSQQPQLKRTRVARSGDS
jgi:hypothetical protein